MLPRELNMCFSWKEKKCIFSFSERHDCDFRRRKSVPTREVNLCLSRKKKTRIFFFSERHECASRWTKSVPPWEVNLYLSWKERKCIFFLFQVTRLCLLRKQIRAFTRCKSVALGEGKKARFLTFPKD
jgi:hypothetical protein